MNRNFSITITFNNNLNIRNVYNTDNDYYFNCFLINNYDTNEITKTN